MQGEGSELESRGGKYMWTKGRGRMDVNQRQGTDGIA